MTTKAFLIEAVHIVQPIAHCGSLYDQTACLLSLHDYYIKSFQLSPSIRQNCEYLVRASKIRKGYHELEGHGVIPRMYAHTTRRG